jgi:DNA-binding response OmpR family regulator
MRSILVVEDEMEIARTLRGFLEVAGFGAGRGRGTAALVAMRGHKPDLVELVRPLPRIRTPRMQERGSNSEYASSTRR